jgi:hypothetical protein
VGAADLGRQLDFQQLYQLSTNSFRARASLPRMSGAHPAMVNITHDRQGSYDGRELRIRAPGR